MTELLQFAEQIVESSDGIVEWNAARTGFGALLSEEMQRGLGLADAMVTIAGPGHEQTGSEDSETLTMGYGTQLLEQLIPMALHMGCAAAVAMPYDASPKKAALNVGSRFAFTNSAFREKGAHMSRVDYWLWSMEVTADADERQQLQYQTCISGNRVACAGLSELIPGQAAQWEPISLKTSEVSQVDLDRLFTVACHRTLEGLEEGLSAFKATILRHHLRDMERIETYFLDLTREMKDEIERRNLTGADLEVRKEKIAQLSREKAAKISALEDKYRLRISIRPLTLLLARLPVIRCDVLLKRRKKERRISVVYNLLSRDFDPLPCEACGVETYSPGLCDDALHLLCPACLAAFTNKKACPRCRGKKPPETLDRVFKHLGIQTD
ncbi:conserved hypothetical protein [delta proteobacterium NaphS2]|nr:conserved hypothetical protein [delta proteobacterium NaphS2]